MMLQFDAVLFAITKGPLPIQCIALKDKLHERDSEMVAWFEEIRSWYAENIIPSEDAIDIGEFTRSVPYSVPSPSGVFWNSLAVGTQVTGRVTCHRWRT